MKRKIVIALIAVIIVAEIGFLLKKSMIFWPHHPSDVVMVEEQAIPESKKEIPADWATAKSGSGFSVRYPSDTVGAMFGDSDGLLSLFFVFDPKAIGVEGDELEKLQDDIDGLKMQYQALVVTVLKPESDNLSSQAEAIVVRDGNSKEKTLSHRSTPTTFSGQEAYIITRQMEAPENQGKAHYIRKDIFFLKGEYLYRISRVAPADDTVFPRSGGSTGKEFLSYVGSLSSDILQTFVFDGSSRTSIVVPPHKAPGLSGDAKERREGLLAALRQGPYFDEQKGYEEIKTGGERCDEYGQLIKGSSRDLTPSPGVFYSVNDIVSGENEVVEIHGYDDQGGHTGPIPMPGFGGGSFPEESARGIESLNRYGGSQMLAVSEPMNGHIEIRGKKFSLAEFRISGEGNSCSMADLIVPTTPYSIATVPITERGDIGPISYDIDGDGVEDLKISLIHPLLPEKEEQLSAVYADMSDLEKK
jgi:hypothetical protein